MGEPAGGAVPPAAWFPAPELTPTLGPLRDRASRPNNWMLWAMPPPPPSSLPAAGSEPALEAQPHEEARTFPGAPPPFDAHILPGAQPPFDAQSPLDSQPQPNGQPSWNFQASASRYWTQSPGGFPWHQQPHSTPGRLLTPLRTTPYLSFPSLLPPPFPPLFPSSLLILPCTLGVRSLMSHSLFHSYVFLTCSFSSAIIW